MFARPRPKRAALVPPPKRRKTNPAVEEVNFDFDARSEYLTGFHKRKLLRSKKAQEENAKKEREEKIAMRKQLREERKQDIERHVEAVNALLKEARAVPGLGFDSDEEEEEEEEEGWEGIDQLVQEVLDHEQEYIDEDRYTTVTVEEVDVTKQGLSKTVNGSEDEEPKDKEKDQKSNADTGKAKKVWPKKEKKKKFRYESKAERKLARAKQKSKAIARRGEE